MEFGLLGPLVVVDRGRPVPIQSARHRVLLAAPLLRAGELVMVDELAEAVWGDALPASPRKAIQTHVSRLRRVLSDTELIEWQPTGYAMRVDRDELDVGRFELLLETPAPGRYRLHDLLRLYARELAGRHHPEPVRAAALTRALGFYVATAWRTLALLRPGDRRLARADQRWTGGLEFADEQAALAWLEAERANLLAAIAQAATTPGIPAELAIQLAQALVGFFQVRKYLQDWEQANQAALGVARRIGDRAAQAQTLNDLGYAYWRRGRYDQSLAHHQESLALYRELGDRGGQAKSMRELGVTLGALGRAEEARAHWLDALAISEP